MPERRQYRDQGRQAVLQEAWLANAAHPTHPKREIAGAGVDEQPLENVRMLAEVRAPHAARLKQMREGALQQLAASAQQRFAAISLDPPPVGATGTSARRSRRCSAAPTRPRR